MWPKVSTQWPHVFNLSESGPGTWQVENSPPRGGRLHGKLKTRRHRGGSLTLDRAVYIRTLYAAGNIRTLSSP
jgi:hypothetical protein